MKDEIIDYKEKYIIITSEDGVIIKEPLMDTKTKACLIAISFFSIVLSLIICNIPIYILACEFLLKEKPYIPNIITFILVFIGVVLLGIFVLPYTLMGSIENNKKFSFTIDNNGVSHRSKGKTYSLRWEEINSFGIINGVLRNYFNYRSVHTCLYFSKRTFIKLSSLRKQVGGATFFKLNHSSREILVLEFDGNEFQDYIRKEIYPYINMYCDFNKEYPSLHDGF